MPAYMYTTTVDTACWAGTLSTFELRLLKPLPKYALEQLRVRFLASITTTGEPTKAARAALQMAFETELGSVLAKLITLAPDVLSSKICERRTHLQVDTDMAKYSFLWKPAIDDVRALNILPSYYVDMLEAHYASPYPRSRACTIAVLLGVAASYLIEDV